MSMPSDDDTLPCKAASTFRPTLAQMSSPAQASTSATGSSLGSSGMDRLPQPQNSNHLSTAPLKDKLLTNSSYLAAEIPLKFGHFVSNLWTSGSELSNSFFMQRSKEGDDQTLWLLGRPYAMPSSHFQMQQDILEAQRDTMFQPASAEPSSSPTTDQSNADQSDVSTPSADPTAGNHSEAPTSEIQEGSSQQPFAMSLLWPSDFYEDFVSRFWMTYRHNYPPIRPSAHRTDIGWGCMLRSGQSLLANTLLVHFFGRDWKRKGTDDPTWPQYCKIVHWFLDELSPRAPFSIHRIALLGKQLGKNIGEWFGPSTISQVIQALVSDFPSANLAVYIATDGVVYREDVRDVATGKKPRGEFGYMPARTQPSADSGHDEARALFDRYSPKQVPSQVGPFKSVLVLVAIRLGIDHLHPTYHAALKTCFELPYFVGIAGGRPNSSLYFIGLQGDDLIYLDPHFSRPALETKSLSDYTELDFSSYHCTIPRKINISNVDPSMLLGFYCRSEAEFDSFCADISEMAKQCPAIFTIEQQAPEYDEDVRSENDFGVVSDDELDAEEGDDGLV